MYGHSCSLDSKYKSTCLKKQRLRASGIRRGIGPATCTSTPLHGQVPTDGFYFKASRCEITFCNAWSRVHELHLSGDVRRSSFARTTGNVWSNPELTCQHVDPESSSR